MFKALCILWRDEAGFVLSAELIMIATVVTLALVVGLAEVSGAVNNELRDMAGAVQAMNQGWWYGNSGYNDWSNGGNGGDGSNGYAFDQSGNN
jgi:hypothetical protein